MRRGRAWEEGRTGAPVVDGERARLLLVLDTLNVNGALGLALEAERLLVEKTDGERGAEGMDDVVELHEGRLALVQTVVGHAPHHVRVVAADVVCLSEERREEGKRGSERSSLGGLI